MAHGRAGPDIVMTTRYAGASEIRALSEHERNRTPDGSSAIDPERSHLNQILLGPATQQEALDRLWASGVKRPTAQAEAPYVQMTLSASPGFFRDEGQGDGEWNQEKLEVWRDKTLTWLRHEYGEDLVHAALHLDETTPHLHVLIVPTYEKKPRVPGRQKRGETIQEFEARRVAAQESETIRTAGRSSSPYWRRVWARREARKSYHAVVEDLGLGYGRDFVEEGEPSPERVQTGTWVKQQAAELAAQKVQLEAQHAAIEKDRAAARADREAVAQERASVAHQRRVLEVHRRGVRKLEEAANHRYEKNEAIRRALVKRRIQVRSLGSKILAGLGKEATGQITLDFNEIVRDLNSLPAPAPEPELAASEDNSSERRPSFGAPFPSAPEDPGEDAGPGF
jgi:hypothetical protein